MTGILSEAPLDVDTKVLLVGGHPAGSEGDPGWLDREWHRADLEHALREFHELAPDVVLIDCPEDAPAAIGLVELLRVMCPIPILALADAGDAGIDALRAGADAVVPKPVSREELDLRIRRVLERAERTSGRHGDELVEIDHLDRRVFVAGNPVHLTPTEFRLLATFMEHPGVVLSHGELLDLAWGDAYRGESEVKLYVSYLRRSFAPAGVDPIETVRGVGYAYRPQRSGVGLLGPAGQARPLHPDRPVEDATGVLARSIGEAYRAYFGNAPGSIKMVRADEIMTVVLHGVFDRSDRTLVDLGRFPEVRRRRRAMGDGLGPELCERVEAALGRPVRSMVGEVYESDLTTLTFTFVDRVG